VNPLIETLNGTSAAWFDIIVRASWQGALVLAVVWLIARFVSRLPAAHKVWLWRLAFLKLLADLIWLSPVVLPILPQQTPAVTVVTEIVTETIPVTLAQAEAPDDLPVPLMMIEPTSSSLHLRAWLFLAWCAALFACTLRVLRHWRDTQSLLRGSRPLSNGGLEECVRALSERLRLRSAPSIGESPAVSSPVLVGIFRPQIILPRGLADSASLSRLELMLAHELAHLRRKDLLWLWLFTVAETLFFFHPLVWLARREWTLATEAVCDEMAIRLTRQTPRDYGEMLVDIVAATSRRAIATPLVAVGIIENAHTLKRRLKLMITTRSRFARIGGMALIAIATLALVPWKLTAQDAEAEKRAARDVDADVAKLKEENAKLRQELEAVRRDAEKMRSDAEQMRKRVPDERQREAALQRQASLQREMAERQTQIARDHARHVERQQRDMEKIRAELEELRTRFTDEHPVVRERRAQLEKMEAAIAAAKVDRSLEDPLEPKREAAVMNERAMKRQEQQKQQRALLQKEIELVERHVAVTRKNVEAGVQSHSALLAAQRELLDVKLQLAKVAGSKDEARAAVEQQIEIAKTMLKENRQLVEQGLAAVGSELPLEREVLRLTRKLHELEETDLDK
jgi:beta-lactamase regulating signal transducer with metallopeptidase domain